MATKEALDAVNAAINSNGETLPPEPAKVETTDETEEGEEAPNSETGGVGDDAEPAKVPDGEKPADGKAKVADGEPAKDEKPGDKKPDAAAAKDGEKPADGAAKPDDKAKPPAKAADPVNDPIPSQVSERTRERMTSLITMVKEKEVEAKLGRELFSDIESAGMSAEELGTMLSYSKLIHSDNIEDHRKAFNFLQSELRGLALRLGETNVGLDFLTDYPDLREQVDSGAITEAAARELALSRERSKVTEQSQARATETAEQAAAAHNAGNVALTDLGRTLQLADPLYAQKMVTLGPELKTALEKIHPSKWVEHVRKAYFEYKAPVAAPVVAPVVPVGPKGEPLRPNKQPSGDGAKQPTSAREAMDAALSGLGT